MENNALARKLVTPYIRFGAARRVCPVHRDHGHSQSRSSDRARKPNRLSTAFSTLPEDLKLRDLVRLAKHCWIAKRGLSGSKNPDWDIMKNCTG
jgi:hypothetical protein